MAIDMNKIKNHPGFMPFGSRNVHTNTDNTQAAADKEQNAEEIKHDTNLSAGGEQR